MHSNRKRHRPEKVVAKLRQADEALAKGTPIAEVARSLGVSEVTLHRWRAESRRRGRSTPGREQDVDVRRHDGLSLGRTYSVPTRLPTHWRHLEVRKLKCRRHDAADERPCAERPRRLPPASRHDRLRRIAVADATAQHDARARARHGVGKQQLHRVAVVEEPMLVGIDSVPTALLASRKQEQDRRAGTARCVGCAERLAVETALGMPNQTERSDHVVGGQWRAVVAVRVRCHGVSV